MGSRAWVRFFSEGAFAQRGGSTATKENLKVLAATDAAFNARDWKGFEKLHAKSVVVYGPDSPEPTRGVAAHRRWVEGFIGAFPDLRVRQVRSFGGGDWACAEYVIAGTHEGPLAGPGGQAMPATKKKVQFRLCNVLRFEGGKIAEEIAYFDFLGMLSQLGVLPGI